MDWVKLVSIVGLGVAVSAAQAQDVPVADPADIAFEEGRWEDAIAEYRSLLEASPEDRLSLLRIAQAQHELGRYTQALETLDAAQAQSAPEAMVDLERARNLLALGRQEDALVALDSADHLGLRALELLQESEDFAAVRDEPRFQRVLRSVRSRVFPCEGMPEANQFDFWLGRWEVRLPAGTLVGHNTITKQDGGCTILEQWDGAGGATGTSVTFYVPSRGQWRQVWTGSSGTLIDMTGGLTDSGEMHMEGTIEYVSPESVIAFRATWSEAPDGRVRQRMEEFDLVAQTWVVWFDGIYRRVDEAQALN